MMLRNIKNLKGKLTCWIILIVFPQTSSWTKYVSSGRTVMAKAIRGSSIRTRSGKSSKLGMLISKPRKRTILVCICGRHKIGWKETKSWSDVEKYFWKKWPTSFLDHVHVYLGWTQRECETRKDLGQLNPRSLQEQKSYHVQWNLKQTSPHGPVMWKVMQRNVWSDIVSWRTKQPSNCTKLQLHALMTIISEKKIETRGRIVKSMLSNCSEMLVLGTYWKTWYSMVSK